MIAASPGPHSLPISVPDRDDRRSRAAHRSRVAAVAVLCGLFVQFLLGMYLNLYVPHLHGQPVLVAHILLGTCLVLGALFAAIHAISSRRRDHIAVSLVALVALGLAWRGGIRFLNAGEHASDSYLMATAFACAVAAYIAGLLALGARTPKVVHQATSEPTIRRDVA
jgi:uncharacterized membrane protein YccC